MPRRINPTTAPAPVSNYAQIVEVEAGARTAFISGQVGIDPGGNTYEGFADQCRQAFDNIAALLAAVDMTLDDVVRLNAYVTDAGDIGIFRDVRDELITAQPGPASTLVVVAALASPQWVVEIEAVAATP